MNQQHNKLDNFHTNAIASECVDAKFDDDDLSLRELFSILWSGKWTIIIVTAVFAISGVTYALFQPNTYKSEALLVPASESGNSGLAGMAAQFGGLASLAGINISGAAGSETAIALATLESRQFLVDFIDRHELLVPLMASKKWDQKTQELILDEEIYSIEKKEWVRVVEPPRRSKPSPLEAYEEFRKDVLNVTQSKDTGLVTISITHHSPLIAQRWALLIVEDLNAWMKEKSLTETKRNIGYLVKQLEKTSVTEMQTVFYQLIEDQTKQLMLSEVENEFSFKMIDPPVIPEEKFGPRRALICILITLFGGITGVLIVMVRHFLNKK